MADESAGGNDGSEKLNPKSYVSPGLDIVKAVPQGIIELVLRGVTVVLALISLIVAAVVQSYLRDLLRFGINLVTQTNLTAGWVIFLSFWVMLYQIVVIVQLFIKFKILYIKVPVINWSIFSLVDIVAIAIAVVGYLSGAAAMAAYADQLGVNGSNMYSSSAAATSAFSFFSMFVHIGMIIYFLVARYVLKWSTHGEESIGGKSQDNYQVDQ